MENDVASVDLEKLASLCKRRGFVFQSSEIYGGLASTWDYGPLGVELKRNVKEAWWTRFVLERDDMVGLDTAILMHPDVWRASGHVESFADPLVECKACQQRFRHDYLWFFPDVGRKTGNGVVLGLSVLAPSLETAVLGMTHKGVESIPPTASLAHSTGRSLSPPLHGSEIARLDRVPCPACDNVGSLTAPRQFNLMFRTFMGPVEDAASTVYLRPETAQGIFVNFDNVVTTTRRRPPFGVAQIGKAFRNEITTGNFIFRTREFEMMEIEFFVPPGQDDAWHRRWIDESVRWYTDLGVRPDRLKVRAHEAGELSHYSKATSDIEYRFPWGWGEILGVANRTDYDLRAHAEKTGKPLSYFDEGTSQHVVPFVIEPSAGVDRAVLTFLVDAYTEEDAPTASGGTERRVVLKLHPRLAPVKVAVLPLSRNERLVPLARDVYDTVRRSGAVRGVVQYDDAQGIGRRYRRQDEVGTPLCVTVDFDSFGEWESLDGKGPAERATVTVRERDSMAQVRVSVAELPRALADRLAR